MNSVDSKMHELAATVASWAFHFAGQAAARACPEREEEVRSAVAAAWSTARPDLAALLEELDEGPRDAG